MISTTFNEIEPPVVSAIEPYSSHEIEEIVVIVRLDRYNRNLPYGANVIRKIMETYGIKPLPSVSCIGNILRRQGLTYRRTGNY